MESPKCLNKLEYIFNQYNEEILTEDEVNQEIQKVVSQLDLSNVEILKYIKQKIKLIESGRVKDQLSGIIKEHFPVAKTSGEHLSLTPIEMMSEILSKMKESDLVFDEAITIAVSAQSTVEEKNKICSQADRFVEDYQARRSKIFDLKESEDVKAMRLAALDRAANKTLNRVIKGYQPTPPKFHFENEIPPRLTRGFPDKGPS